MQLLLSDEESQADLRYINYITSYTGMALLGAFFGISSKAF
jgi:hypothetical protein